MQFFEEGTFTGKIADAASSRTATRELEKIKTLSESFGGMFSDKFTDEMKSKIATLEAQKNKQSGTLTISDIYRSIIGNN
jgi:hypothetical protein